MQEYLQRTRLGEWLDRLGFRLLMLAGSLGWFILLWGLRLPALAAGIALFLLILLLEKKTRDGRLLRREKRLRMLIGGELALERMILESSAKAHFEMAMLLSLQRPITLLRSGENGMICSRQGEIMLISFLQLPPSAALNAAQVLSFQREAKAQRATRALLCVPCAIGPDAQAQAKGEIPVSFLSRETLIRLIGTANPATDDQLVSLGKRKRAHAPPRRWLQWILHRRRGPRYGLYGGILLIMYLLTRLFYYAIPGLLCVGLAAACRCVKSPEEEW